MSHVLVQPPGCCDSSSLLRVLPGSVLTFGRGAPDLPVDLLLVHPGVSRLAGEITVAADHWQLTNHSSHASYVVENPEGAGEHIRISPRRYCAPIPFEISRILVPAGRDTLAFLVFAPSQWFLEAPGVVNPTGGDRTLRAFPLDEGAKYFRVLVALCEPRLRDTAWVIPSAEQVVERLRGLPGCADLSARAVDFHIDYLTHTKLRLRPAAANTSGVASRRELLVTFALRFGLVTEDHLGLLPTRFPAGTSSRAR
jgi:hypothetical protein